jgi:hypothetical protein
MVGLLLTFASSGKSLPVYHWHDDDASEEVPVPGERTEDTGTGAPRRPKQQQPVLGDDGRRRLEDGRRGLRSLASDKGSCQ